MIEFAIRVALLCNSDYAKIILKQQLRFNLGFDTLVLFNFSLFVNFSFQFKGAKDYFSYCQEKKKDRIWDYRGLDNLFYGNLNLAIG